MSDISFLEWNINQATNRSGNNIIPDFVFDEIKETSADLVVLAIN